MAWRSCQHLRTPVLQIKHQHEHPQHQKAHKTPLAPPRISRSNISADVTTSLRPEEVRLCV